MESLAITAPTTGFTPILLVCICICRDTLPVSVVWRKRSGKGGCEVAAYWWRLAANLVLKVTSFWLWTMLLSSWFQSAAVRMKEFFSSSVAQWGTTYALLFLAHLFVTFDVWKSLSITGLRFRTFGRCLRGLLVLEEVPQWWLGLPNPAMWTLLYIYTKPLIGPNSDRLFFVLYVWHQAVRIPVLPVSRLSARLSSDYTGVSALQVLQFPPTGTTTGAAHITHTHTCVCVCVCACVRVCVHVCVRVWAWTSNDQALFSY